MDGLLFDLPFSDVAAKRPRPPRQRRAAGAAETPRPWPLTGGINVVLFAGMGGACQGLEDAGLPIHVACNHDEVAIAAHRALNPHTRHLKADIYEVDPVEATGGRRVGILWGSPDCTHHSVAKGGAPVSPRVRSMPWQMCRWIGVLRKRGLGPDQFFLENVREIRSWGPLVAKRDKATGRVLKLDGSVAGPGERVPRRDQQLVGDPRWKGRTYRAWVRHIEGLGAHYDDRDHCCADFGVPTSRNRLFGAGRFDGRPIRWPEQTHASRKDLDRLNSERKWFGLPPLLPHRAAAEIIDWTLPLPSIFDRKKPLAPATRKRIATGMKRFVLESASPFLVHLTHGARLHDIDQPAPTMTCAHRGEVALVGPALVPTTHTTDPTRVHDGLAPVPTLTAGVKGGEFAAMTATIVGAGGRAAQAPPMDPTEPLNTSTTKEDRCVVAAHLTRYHGERRPDEARGIDPADPLATLTTENRFGMIGAFLEEHRTGSVGQPAGDPLTTQTAKEHSAVVAATMVQTGYGEREGQAPRALDIGQPVGTMVAGGAKHGVVGAFMVQHNTGVVGHSPDEPLSTMTTVGTQQQVAAAYLTEFRGTSADGQAVTEPAPTLCTGGDRGGGHSGVTAAFLSEYYGTGGQHQPCDAPLNTLTTNDRFAITGCALSDDPAKLARARQVAEFLREHGAWTGGDLVTVTIRGTTWIVVDIGMRMLTPREAAAAHELRMPDLIQVCKRDRMGALVIDQGGNVLWETRPLTKTEAMRLIGNSVPKRMAMLLAQANAVHALHHTPALTAAE